MNTHALQKMLKNRFIIKAFVWNMGGICFYYLCRWLINISVVRMSADYTDAGLLTLAVSITGIWNAVALFSVRNIQVSDDKNEYTDSEYVSLRIVTVSISIIFCVVHALLFTGDIYKILVISVYMVLVASTSYVDVMHGILQRQWRMDVIGISFVFRGIAILALFILLYYFSGLLLAVIGMALISVAIAFIYDIRNVRKYTAIKISFNFQRILSIAKICLPLVVVSFLASLIPTVTRMVLEKLTDTETLGIYGSVTLPATIIQTVVASAFAPFTNIFTKHLHQRNYKGYLQAFWAGVMGITISVALFLALTFLFGEWLMSLLFGSEIVQYTYLFREATIYSGLNCLSWFIAIPLIVFRYIKTIMVIYAGGVVVCVTFLMVMIERFGVSGANYIQIAAYAVITVSMLIASVVISKKEFKNPKKGDIS